MEETRCISISGGFTNQLLALITGLFNAKVYSKKIGVIGNFASQYDKNNDTPFSKIVDIEYLNKIIGDLDHNVTVYDKNFFDLQCISVLYGENDKYVDITNEVYNKFLKTVFIPRHIELNKIKGDPILNVKKKIIITYSVNGKEFKSTYSEYRNNDIILNFDTEFVNKPDSYIHTFGGICSWDRKNIDYILSNLNYTDYINNLTIEYTKSIKTNKINVIHIRFEEDGIKHWSNINKMSIDEFKNKLYKKYTDLITQYFSKDEHIIVLTYDNTNPVIEFMRNNGYLFSIRNKDESLGREVNAAIDINSSRLYNNVFIGCCNPVNSTGSTFSFYAYLLAKKNNAKTITFDIENSDFPDHVE